MRRLILATLVLALAAPAAADAAFTISTRGAAVSKIGPFRPAKDASFDAAIAAFGEATGVRRAGQYACVAEWLNFGLEIRFVTFGGGNPCVPTVGLAQTFEARSRRFRTWKGLKPGAAEARIPELHPAEKHGRSWWLQRGERPGGDGRLLPVLQAKVADGRVTRLTGWIGGAGD